MTIAQLVQDTWIQSEDIVAALKEMAVIEAGKGTEQGKVMLDKRRLVAWAAAHAVSLESPVDVHAFSDAAECDNIMAEEL